MRMEFSFIIIARTRSLVNREIVWKDVSEIVWKDVSKSVKIEHHQNLHLHKIERKI